MVPFSYDRGKTCDFFINRAKTCLLSFKSDEIFFSLTSIYHSFFSKYYNCKYLQQCGCKARLNVTSTGIKTPRGSNHTCTTQRSDVSRFREKLFDLADQDGAGTSRSIYEAAKKT